MNTQAKRAARFANGEPATCPTFRRIAGMTLVEMMVGMAVFSLVVLGMVYTQMMCLRQDQLVNSKLGASDQSRKGFDILLRDIRSAKVWEVGTSDSDGSNFTPTPDDDPRIGNALCLSYTTNLANGILYYFDTSDMANDGGKLNRLNLGNGTATRIAVDLTNVMYFRAENFAGVVQTNRTHKGVIAVRMEFAQYQYPLTKVGPGNLYDYYKMEFKVTSHCPDGP